MNIQQIVEQLKQQQVVAYPTEAVFGLGCNPNSEEAVNNLLKLKQRSIDKGLILVSPNLDFLLPFIDISRFKEEHWVRLSAQYSMPTTWIVPATRNTPRFLTGKFNSIAVRLCEHPAVKELCEQAGFALTSTSANLTGLSPCRRAEQVREQFGEDFPVLDLKVGNANNPSEIRDLFTNQLVRKG